MPNPPIEAVLFDLDGTLADTAPDLVGALERLRVALRMPAIETGGLRALASRGAVAILEAGLPELDEAEREALRPRFIDDYKARCWEASRPFDGMPECLAQIEATGMKWGIVTNKLEYLAAEVAARAGWNGRAGCLVAGDSAARPKPAPDPVLAACERLGAAPGRTLFVGDDERDVIAGRAAGTLTAAALWGYIPGRGEVAGWGAHFDFESPRTLAEFLDGQNRSVPDFAAGDAGDRATA